MKASKKFAVMLWLLAVVSLAALPGAAWAESFSHLKLDSNQISWSDLSFRAENWLVRVQIDVQLSPSAMTEADMLSTGNPEKDLWRPLSLPIYDIAVNTVIDPLVGSTVRLSNQALFDPKDAAALRRIRLRLGKNDQKKTYRFTRSGVYLQRIQPNGPQEVPLAPEGWNDVKDRFYACDRVQLGCPGISAPEVIIYIVSAAFLIQDNQPISLCVFSNEQLHHAQLRPEGFQALKVDYLEKNPQATLRKKGTVNALRIAIKAQSMNTDQKEVEDFSFLGFKKDTVLYIEPASRIPIQVSGVIPGAGQVELKLQAVGLRKKAG